jgi:hypothetical protein
MLGLLFSSYAVATGPDAWLQPLPQSLRSAPNQERISEELFFEVQASKEGAAESYLAQKPIIPQTQDNVRWYGQRRFQCPEGATPYLVRAVYVNGGTGGFSVSRIGTSLVVSHGSLGHNYGAHRSALIVCLTSQPTDVYIEAGTAM